MLHAEGILFAMVERENTSDDIAAIKGNAESRLQRGYGQGRSQGKRFGRWIAVGDGLLVARHPSRKTLPHRNSKRREQVEVHTVNIFRNYHAFVANEEDDRIVGNQFLETPGNNRKCFLQAQGVSKGLGQLKEELGFLARRDDGSEKGGRANFRFVSHLCEPRRRGETAVNFGSDVQPPSFGFNGVDNHFQFEVTALHDFHNATIKTSSFLVAEIAHAFCRAHCLTIGTLGSKSIKPIYSAENAGPDTDGFALQSIRITGP